MKNFKINMNRPPLTDAELSGKGDFNSVLKSYKAAKTPFFKAPKFWFGASSVLVASVAAVVIYTKLMTGNIETGITPAFIQPPIAEANIKSESYIIDAGTDSNITHTSGSKIHIPADAFMDENGNPVHGKVELNYREFNNIADVFLAGIPMTYDSAGELFHFETAGMMEISAMQNGKPLKTNPDAFITVDMVSNNNEDRFNTYYLDTVEKKWKYLAQKNFNEPAPVSESDGQQAKPAKAYEQLLAVDAPAQKVMNELTNTKREIAAIEKQKPVEPKKVNKDKHRFKITVDEKEFPEIAVYNNMKFEVDDKNYNPEKAKVLWENVELKRQDGSLSYQVAFSNAKEKYTVTATPVFEDKDITAATRIYEEKYKEYEAKLSKKKSDEVRLKAELEARAKLVEEKIRKEIAEQAEHRKMYEARLSQTDLVFRTFQVADFGVWNCDQPNRLPQGATVIARLKDANTKEALKIQYCYLVEKGRNAMFTYYPTALNNFRFDPKKENMLWVVTNDLKVAVIKPEQFSAAQKTSGEMPLELTVIDKSFKSTEEARAYLEI